MSIALFRELHLIAARRRAARVARTRQPEWRSIALLGIALFRELHLIAARRRAARVARTRQPEWLSIALLSIALFRELHLIAARHIASRASAGRSPLNCDRFTSCAILLACSHHNPHLYIDQQTVHHDVMSLS